MKIENKFYHSVGTLSEKERHSLELEIKPEEVNSIFIECFSFENGIQGFHVMEFILWMLILVFPYSYGKITDGLLILFMLLVIHFLTLLHARAATKKQNRKIKSFIDKEQVFLIRGKIIKKAFINDKMSVVFEDNTIIPVFPIAFHALKESDFIEMRYLKDVISYGDDVSAYHSNRIFKLTLFNADLTASIDLDSSSTFNQYSGYSSRKTWESG